MDKLNYLNHHQTWLNRFKMYRIEVKYKRLVIFILVLASFIFVSYKILMSPQFNSYYLLRRYIKSYVANENQTKVLLLWTDFFGSDKWNIKEMLSTDILNETYFKMEKCPVTNCHITTNRNYLQSIDLYDALIFHTAEPFGLREKFPNDRSNDQQLYIFSLQESPAHTKHDISDEINIYNLTMTYRLDSDIVWPYGYIKDKETGKIVAPAYNPNWRQPVYDHLNNDTALRNLIRNKSKFATWFASHCGTISQRDKVVSNLQEYIKVDVYGRCGNLNCPRSSSECEKRLDTDYKFYFSFENSLCIDYVTEKFFRALEHNIVPVVYGGADYRRFSPPHSYINVEDFQTIEDLASYLKYLDNNPNEYIKYFWWKKYYKIGNQSIFCKICELLNDPARQEKTQFYHNIKNWWFGNSCKLKPNILLK